MMDEFCILKLTQYYNYFLQEDPKESRCLGVFGLSMYTQERELRDLFARYGQVDDVQVVYDHQTGRSRGFAFVYMHNVDDAVEVREILLCAVYIID